MATPGIGVGVSQERPPIPQDESIKVEEQKPSEVELKLPNQELQQPQAESEMVIEGPQVKENPIQTENQKQVVSNLTVNDLEAPVISYDQAQKLQQEILDAANQ